MIRDYPSFDDSFGSIRFDDSIYSMHIFRLFFLAGLLTRVLLHQQAFFLAALLRSPITRLTVTMPRTSCMLSLALFLVASAVGAEERWQVPGQEQLPDIDDVLADFKVSADDHFILFLVTCATKPAF